MEVDDPLASASLTEVASASDLVLVGEVLSREEGVQIGAGTGALPYTAFEIEATEAIKGKPSQTVRVLMITRTEDGLPIEVEGRPTPTNGEAVWLLTRIDPEFERLGEYVLTSTAGVLPVTDGRIAVEHSHTPAVVEAVALGSVERVVAFLSARS